MSISSFFKWYPTRYRIESEITKLEKTCGNRAFLVAIQRYWFAKSDGDRSRANYWKSVSAEVLRRERRRSIVAAALGQTGDNVNYRPSTIPPGLCERTFG